MKVVIDTSAVLAVLLNEPHREELIHLAEGKDLVAPRSLHVEIGNALSAMFKRGRLSLEKAKKVLGSYDQIPLQLVSVDLSKALEVAHRYDMYAYDAYMLVTAENHGSPLLTLDGGLQETARQAGIELMEVNS